MTLQSFDEQFAKTQQRAANAAEPAASASASAAAGAAPAAGSGERRPSLSANSAKDGAAEKEDVQKKKETLGFLGTLSALFKSNSDKKPPPSNIVKTSLNSKKKAVRLPLLPPTLSRAFSLQCTFLRRLFDLSVQDLTQLRFIQGTAHHTGPIWTVSFSCDGNYLATGGQDSIVRVWAVNGSPSAAEVTQHCSPLPPQL
jgi:WD40 repeat protein